MSKGIGENHLTKRDFVNVNIFLKTNEQDDYKNGKHFTSRY